MKTIHYGPYFKVKPKKTWTEGCYCIGCLGRTFRIDGITADKLLVLVCEHCGKAHPFIVSAVRGMEKL